MVRFPPPKTLWMGFSLPKRRNIFDLTASTLEGLSSSESEEDESWPWIFSVILSISDSTTECSAIDLRREKKPREIRVPVWYEKVCEAMQGEFRFSSMRLWWRNGSDTKWNMSGWEVYKSVLEAWRTNLLDMEITENEERCWCLGNIAREFILTNCHGCDHLQLIKIYYIHQFLSSKLN